MSADCSSRIIRFSTFEVNVDTGELRQRGQKVKLQEQPFQVLAALLGPLKMTRSSMTWMPHFESDFANGYDEYGRSLGPDKPDANVVH